ncbi:MAG: hypothetical protein IKS23_00500 [Alphaproteobacteria bacterium]|nr:hypothetical protein [Alphaproteobacteria bacterium]
MKKEETFMKRQKHETDLTSVSFAYSWCLRDQNGKALKSSDRLNFWRTFKSLHPDFFVYVSTGGFHACVMPYENIPLFQEWLKNEKGVLATPNKSFQRNLLDTDLSYKRFTRNWFLKNKDTNCSLSMAEKGRLWSEFCSLYGQTLFVQIPTHGKTLFVLPQENTDALKSWLSKTKGIQILSTEPPLRQRIESDITYSQFCDQWSLEKSNGHSVPYEDKSALWYQFQSKNPDLFVRVKLTFVLPQKNIDIFKNWLHEKGINVRELPPIQRQILETDLSKNRLWRDLYIYNESGSPIWNYNLKISLFNEFQNKRPDLFVRVTSAFVLPQENFPAFQNWLKSEKGYTASRTNIYKTRTTQNNNARLILKTDLTRQKFLQSVLLKQKDGKIIEDLKQKSKLFSEFKFLHKNLFIHVRSKQKLVPVLPYENISVLQEWLKNEKGIIFQRKGEPQRDVLKTDLTKSFYTQRWSLRTKNGSPLDYHQKKALWMEAKNEKCKDLFIPVRCKKCKTYILPQENIEAFQKWLKNEKGIPFISTPMSCRDQNDGDITVDHFLKNMYVVDQSGNIIDKRAQRDLFSKAKFGTPNIMVRVQNTRKKLYVLPKENLPAFQEWLRQEKGLTIIDKKALLSAIKAEYQTKQALKNEKKAKKEPKTKQKTLKSQIPAGARLLLETDTIKAQFVCFWKLKKDGFLLDNFKKASYWDALLKDKDQNILIAAHSDGLKTFVLPYENIPAFEEWLKAKGVTPISPQTPSIDQDKTILSFKTNQRVD